MRRPLRNAVNWLPALSLPALPLILLGGCEPMQTVATKVQSAQIATLPTQSGWQPLPNPIIQAGDLTEKGLWNDPHVFKQGSQYVMYMTSSSKKKPLEPPVLPYRAISADGVRWKLNPLQPLMDAGNTPFVSVETPSVVQYRGLYHMFYTGVYAPGGASMFAVGHAVSADGIHWKKDATEALKPTGKPADWNGLIVGEPGAVVHNDKIYVYFTAVGQVQDTPAINQRIGYVTTTDGKNFSAPRIALELSPNFPRSQNFCGYSTPMALVNNGKIHLFYDVVIYNQSLEPQWQQVALSHAVSIDGGQSFRQDSRPIFNRADFDWTKGEIRSPSALFENGQLKLWFAGMVPTAEFRPMILRGIKGREYGIGYATIDASQFEGSR